MPARLTPVKTPSSKSKHDKHDQEAGGAPRRASPPSSAEPPSPVGRGGPPMTDEEEQRHLATDDQGTTGEADGNRRHQWQTRLPVYTTC